MICSLNTVLPVKCLQPNEWHSAIVKTTFGPIQASFLSSALISQEERWDEIIKEKDVQSGQPTCNLHFHKLPGGPYFAINNHQ